MGNLCSGGDRLLAFKMPQLKRKESCEHLCSYNREVESKQQITRRTEVIVRKKQNYFFRTVYLMGLSRIKRLRNSKVGSILEKCASHRVLFDY